MRSAVADTTVLVSAFLTPRGVSSEFLRRAREGAFVLVLAPEILEETRDRLLHRHRIRRRYPYADERVRRFHRLLQTTTTVIADLPPVSGVVRDPNDDMIIACALKARADYVVTRDKDLLSLGAHEGIRMVTPRQFLDLLEGSGGGSRTARWRRPRVLSHSAGSPSTTRDGSLPEARPSGTLGHLGDRGGTGMKRVLLMTFAAGLIVGPALAQEVDIKKAVSCQALAQQFGDSVKTAKAEDAAKKSATDQAKQGDQACNQHNYDAGMDQIRQALQQIGLKAAR